MKTMQLLLLLLLLSLVHVSYADDGNLFAIYLGGPMKTMLLPLLSLVHVSYADDGNLLYCTKGQYLQPGSTSEEDTCLPCSPGNYREETSHRFLSCIECKVAEDHPYRILLDPCTLARDTLFRCTRPEHYYDLVYKDCLSCARCEKQGLYDGTPCSDICCPAPGMLMRNGSCVESVFCRIGERLEPAQDYREGLPVCEECPLNTTNYEERHLKTECTENCTHGYPERLESCRPGEYEVGRSCTQKDMVVCAPCPLQEVTNVRQDYVIVGNITGNKTSKTMGEPSPVVPAKHSPEKIDYSDILTLLKSFGLALLVLGFFLLVIFCRAKSSQNPTYSQAPHQEAEEPYD